MKIVSHLLLLFLIAGSLCAQDRAPGDTLSPIVSLHLQATVINQGRPGIVSPYSGPNSLRASGEDQTSFTGTFYLSSRLWSGSALVVDPEVSGGKGLSSTLGLAGFPNGDIYRVASPDPHLYLGRCFVEQTFPLGDSTQAVPDAANQPGGSQPVRRLVLRAGKLSLTDYFDNNADSHDPRKQFLNWALMIGGAWDYAADTRGYTWGVACELFDDAWIFHAAVCAVPYEANELQLDTRIADAHSLNLELEHRHTWNGEPGGLHLLVYENVARMGNYVLATTDTVYHRDIALTRAYGRTKTGFVVNLEQQIDNDMGVFARASWNDGKNETWAFTEIDGSLSAGANVSGTRWGRPDDNAGLACIVNTISQNHRDYLAAGGEGFMIGDGKLTYGPESIVEAFYSYQLVAAVAISADYQFILNPAYNRDRGPVHIGGVRLHFEM